MYRKRPVCSVCTLGVALGLVAAAACGSSDSADSRNAGVGGATQRSITRESTGAAAVDGGTGGSGRPAADAGAGSLGIGSADAAGAPARAGTSSSGVDRSGNAGSSGGSGSPPAGASAGSAGTRSSGADSSSAGFDSGGSNFAGFDSGGSSCADSKGTSDPQAGGTCADPCTDIYDPTELPTFGIEIAPTDWDALVVGCEAEDQSYYPVTFHYGAEAVPAMIRLRGGWSWDCEKMQFMVSFNEIDRNGRFHGLRKIVLDAPPYDETLIRERLAFSFMRDLGTPYSCVNNARLEINGEYYGVFANLERVDRGYVKRNFVESDGNLYKEGRELTTNEETGDTVTVDAFWAATVLGELESLVDLEQAVQVWAGLAMIPDADSYWAGVEINFYFYQHPTRGLQFVPYDMDAAFQRGTTYDPITHEHPNWLREEQYRLVLSDARWCTAFENALRRARAAYDVPELERRIDRWSAQIETAIAEDPNRTFTADEARGSLTDLRAFPAERAAFVDDWLAQGSHCPPEWP
ncbi:CotH kinase family protein [Myxococcota bacterium]